MGKELKMQPSLFHVPTEKDNVYTPDWLARDMVEYFKPTGICLDPCRGDGAFFRYLPAGSQWCEIENGRDFYAWTNQVDWVIGNPPYSHLLAWIRYSFMIANNVAYLIPYHRVTTSSEFMDTVDEWGGLVHVRRYGTGYDAGFPFGHALVAVHYQKGFQGDTSKSRYIHIPK